ncbi:hypothetical protein [uncultured Gammaproteobacteria bacterium]|nr:hypothetical protein [uncultured Gammaproteobacteria bacterium]CAC9558413.1 hypothetical protein [uncultured Gammaproteobacteria bacterium]CAC9569606.1 hypothetical protein [uncultured Gammaproteobacteria bacterium]CAC9581910.1 hypothetical protein [uncultured Gammaproteobacteria bacterium]CAC9950988.1 hypothetical protein [uncultured Gammaproteobacteria bacterium]
MGSGDTLSTISILSSSGSDILFLYLSIWSDVQWHLLVPSP